MLKIEFNRYNPEAFMQCFNGAAIKKYKNEAAVEFTIEEYDYEVYLPLIDGNPDPESITTARDVLGQINTLDNLVQESCASECKRTGISPNNYELYLACIFIGGSSIKLRYYGAKVNTEWDAEFKRNGTCWVPINL